MVEDPVPSPDPTQPALASPIALALLERVLCDRRDGVQRTGDDYVAMFPGHEDLVRNELARLTASMARGDDYRIGRYRVLETIGRGGQGTVYLGLDERLGRRVALKLLTGLGGSSDSNKQRFRREAQAASRLQHPGLCALLDADEHDGVPFLVMQHIDGRPLLQHLESLSTDHRRDAAVRLFERIARALHHAHENGFVHRDVKPANVLVTAAGDPIVIDFGLVRGLGAEDAGLTRSGELFGTPAYLAPEQILASSPLADRRVDVWALGVSLYEALAGRRPFTAPTYEALCRAITDEEPTDLRRVPTVGSDLSLVVATALAKEPASRYATAAAFADDLGRVLRGEPVLARPVTVWMRTRRWARRNRLLATFLVLAVVQLVVGAVVSTLFVQRGIQNREWERVADLRAVEHILAEAGAAAGPAPSRIPVYDAWLERADRLVARLPLHRRRLEQLRAEALPATAADLGEPALDDRLTELAAEAEFAGKVATLRARRDRYAADLAALPADAPDWQRIDATAWASLIETPLRFAEHAAARLSVRADEAATIRARQTERTRWRLPSEIAQSQHDQIEKLITLVERMQGTGPGTIADIRARRDAAAALQRRLDGEDAAAWRRCVDDVARVDSPYRGLRLRPIAGLVPLGIDDRSGLWEFWHIGTGPRPQWQGEPSGRGRVVLADAGDEGVVLVLVPGGVFTMGSSRPGEGLPNAEPRAQPAEWPPHEVALDAFLMGKYEITHAQWATHGDPDTTFFSPRVPSSMGVAIDRRHPATKMAWQQAHDFCTFHDLDLPTEAQWEYAMRAGRTTRFPTGDDPDSLLGHTNLFDITRLALYPGGSVAEIGQPGSFDDGFAETAPVGSFLPNGFGLHDLIGNAGEWCRDRFFFFEQRRVRPGDGQRGSLAANHERTARVSCYLLPAIYCRSAMRSYFLPDSSWPFLGFRVMRRLDP